nr:immunoglobulin light chain junction region [Macaca mulatta]MOV78028.1 immunoglobulin light chain junction region [Macaca mulatta]MOV78524.1 immunoglobulin light chain junction region [Macaca mulatta]MOV79237.1 immunoglobulin light chain junction region [Macaca mulatta]MOV80081.1 immunoglobulin light chain junction region [Macaca mulatta]
CVQALEFPWTF